MLVLHVGCVAGDDNPNDASNIRAAWVICHHSLKAYLTKNVKRSSNLRVFLVLRVQGTSLRSKLLHKPLYSFSIEIHRCS
jgi:hypothetical protein